MEVPEGAAPSTDPISPVARALSAEAPAAPAPASEPSPLSRVLLDDSQDIAKLTISRNAAEGTDPSKAARILRLEMQTGFPSGFIAENIDDVEKSAADQSFSAEELRRSSPKFAEWLARNPNHYALAKDDIGFFGRVEKAYRSFSEGVKSVPIMEDLSDLLNQEMDGNLPLGGTERIARLSKVLQEEQQKAQVLDSTIDYAARQAGYAGRQFLSTAKVGAQGAAMGGPIGAGYGTFVAPGLGTAAGYTQGLAAGGLSASWLYSYRMERAFAYKELREINDIDGRPMDPNTARLVATGVGVINGAIEVGSDYILARLIPGLSSVFSLGKAGVRSAVKVALTKPTLRSAFLSGAGKLLAAGGTEGLEEIAQALTGATGREIAQAATDQTFKPDSLKDDVTGALQQGLDAFVGTTLTLGGGIGGAHFALQLREARKAEAAERFVSALSEGVDSKAFKELPEKGQEAVREIVADGPLKTAYIDTETWTEFFQKKGLDPREAAAEVLGDTKAYDDAVARGHELAIPMENYARKIAVAPEINDFFRQEIRRAPGVMNARESREFFQKVEEEDKAAGAAESAKGKKSTESGAAVKAAVLQQLKDAGYDDKTARTQAELLSGFEALGQRAGIDPLELFNRYVFKIRKSAGAVAEGEIKKATGETLFQRAKRVVREALGVTPHPEETAAEQQVTEFEQPAYHGTPHEFDSFSLEKIGTGEGAQAFGWGLYFAGNKEVAEFYKSKLVDQPHAVEWHIGDIHLISGGEYQDYSPRESTDRAHARALLTENLFINEHAIMDAWMGNKASTSEKTGIEGVKSVIIKIIDEHIAQYKEDYPGYVPTLQEIRRTIDKKKGGLVFNVKEPKGRLYKVEIPEDSEYLDWDHALTKSQADIIDPLVSGLLFIEQNKETKDWNIRIPSGPGDTGIFIRGPYETEQKAREAITGSMVYRALSNRASHQIYARSGEFWDVIKDNPNRLMMRPDEVVSRYLSSRGIPGIKYAAGQISGAKGLGSNYVIFDDKLIKILEYEQRTRESGQGPEGEARGRIRFGPNRQVDIELLKNANLSTFVHELWHFYFEVMADLSDEIKKVPADKRSSGQQSIIDDYETLLKHVGAADRSGVTEPMHEQIARLGEAYLMQGSAPSSELRRAFARFKVWLTHIYRDIKALAVNLKPEVVRVFDRMLATQDQIDQVSAEQNVAPLFGDPKTLLGEKDAERYLEAVAEARMEAEEELSAKVFSEIDREQQEWWKEERAKVMTEIEAQVNAQPVYRALMALQSREGDTPQIKLDKAAIEAMWVLGEGTKKNLPRGITAKEGGLHPSIVAEMFGFKTAFDLLDALASAEPRLELINKLADERMADLHGDLSRDVDRMHEEALSALHNKKRSALLHRELEILAEKYMPQLKGLTFKIARRPTSIAAVRSMAEGVIASKQIKEINPVIYRRAEAKASKQAIEAMLKGDFDTAFQAKQKELLNHELCRYATEAREDIDKALERFKKIARKDEDLIKTRDIDLVNAARAVLATFGIGRRTKEGAVSYLDQMMRYDPDMYETIKALIANAQGVASYDEATYGDFVYLKDTVDALWDLSRRTRQVMINGKLMDRAIIVEALSGRIAEISAPGQKAGYDRALSKWEEAKIGLMGMRSALRRVESWVDSMDGGDLHGVFRNFIWTPISEGTAAYRIDKKAYLQRYLDIVKKVEKSLTREDIKAPEIGYTFSGKAELLGALLHTGNESNLSKLLRGRGWGMADEEGRLDSSRWDSFISRAVTSGILTKDDYDYCQAVWDLLDELKPRAQKAHKDMYGYYFAEITAREFDTPWGKYQGGYVPAVANPFLAADAAIREEKEQIEKGNNSFMFPTTGRGFTKGRIEKYAVPLMMDVRFVPGHIDKVLRFINIEPRVKDIARIVMDRGFRKTLDALDQTVGGDMLVPWLQRAASQRIDTPTQGWGGKAMDRIARELRNRVGLQIMFGNASNTLQQFTGLSLSAVKVKPKYLRSALWAYVRQPSKMSEMIAQKSAFMSTRVSAKVIEIQQSIDDMMLNPTKYEQARAFARQHGYFLQGATQSIVDDVTWMGAYDQATEAGSDERNAVMAADSAVRLTQGSFSAEDISRFETGSPAMRLFTMFYGYFNMQANLLGSEFQSVAQDMGLRKGAGRLLYLYMYGFAIPAILGDIIVKAASGDKWDEDDDGYLDDILVFFFAAQARTGTAMFPFIGAAVQSGINAFNDKWYDDKISTSPAVSMLESAVGGNAANVYKAIQGREVSSKKAIRDSLTLIGLMTGFPAAAAARPLGYLADVSEGRARPAGVIDFSRGLITGKAGGK